MTTKMISKKKKKLKENHTKKKMENKIEYEGQKVYEQSY